MSGAALGAGMGERRDLIAAALPADIGKSRDAEIFCLLMGVVFCSVLMGLSWIAWGRVGGEWLDGGEWTLAAVGGVVVGALPTILW